MARLIILSGGRPEQTVELGGEVVTLGRDAGNTVVLSGESKASRRHCQIAPLVLAGKVEGGGKGGPTSPAWEIVDLQSTNGTRVNGSPVKRQRLVPGDVIEVGLTKMTFEDAAAAAARDATPSVCYLEYTAGPRRGERVPLTSARTTLGRRDSNTIVLDDKMSSGHHAEIVRDLNGYTVRDLGSTNGTLVNGEPVTETLLVHGARLRVGNAKMVFKDPAMKDVEVALAGLEEDDGGWGMMAEVDLSKVRRPGSMGLLAAVIFLVLATGAGMYLAAQQGQGAAATDPDAGNLVADGRFEAPDVPYWTVDEGSPATVDRTETEGPKKSAALVVKHVPSRPGTGVARYADDFELTSDGAYRVSAAVRKAGDGRGDLAMQWIRRSNAAGSTAVSQTVRIGSAARAWAKVAIVVRRPSWAQVGRLVALVEPDVTLYADDVRLESIADAGPAGVRLGEGDVAASIAARIEASGTLSLMRTQTVVLLGGSPVARLSDGKVVGGPGGFVPDATSAASGDAGSTEVAGRLFDPSLPASERGEGVQGTVSWTRTKEGVAGKATVEGASAVGFAFDVPRAHLDDGIGVLGTFGAKKVSAEPAPPLEGVRKVLFGDARPRDEWNRPSTLVAVSPVRDGAASRALTLETSLADDDGLLRLRVLSEGTVSEATITTSFESESAMAREQLTLAERMLDTARGQAIASLLRVAQEFPFQETVRKTALEKAAAAQAQARADLEALDASLRRFTVLPSEEALTDAEARSKDLGRQFPERGAGDPLEQSIAGLVAKIRAARWKFDADRAAPEVKRLTRIAQLLEGEPGFEVEAVAYYEAIVRRYGAVAEANPGGEAEMVPLVEDAKKRSQALLEKVGSRYPRVPAGP